RDCEPGGFAAAGSELAVGGNWGGAGSGAAEGARAARPAGSAGSWANRSPAPRSMAANDWRIVLFIRAPSARVPSCPEWFALAVQSPVSGQSLGRLSAAQRTFLKRTNLPDLRARAKRWGQNRSAPGGPAARFHAGP